MQYMNKYFVLKGDFMKKFILIIPIFILAAFSSCITSPVCMTSSLTPIQNRVVIENIGKTTGTDWAISVLGIFMIGRPDIDAAIEEAKKAKNADTLVNVRCYETYAYFILFSKSTVRVEGDAVRLGEEIKPETKGKTK
jgi:hypothetical protein